MLLKIEAKIVRTMAKVERTCPMGSIDGGWLIGWFILAELSEGQVA